MLQAIINQKCTDSEGEIITNSTYHRHPQLHSRIPFFPRTIKLWNGLPQHIINSVWHMTFRQDYHNHIVTKTSLPTLPLTSYSRSPEDVSGGNQVPSTKYPTAAHKNYVGGTSKKPFALPNPFVLHSPMHPWLCSFPDLYHGVLMFPQLCLNHHIEPCPADLAQSISCLRASMYSKFNEDF